MPSATINEIPCAQGLPPQEPRTDFMVTRIGASLWTIQARTERARAAARRHFPTWGHSFHGDGVVTDHMTSNDLLFRLRQNGFSILYIGPAGPIEI